MKVLNWQVRGVKSSVYFCDILTAFFRESCYQLLTWIIILFTPILDASILDVVSSLLVAWVQSFYYSIKFLDS